MPAKHLPPPTSPIDDAGTPPAPSESDWGSWTPTQASYSDLTTRLANADLRMCEMQAHMDELIDANCRLRAELGEMTLQWVIEKTKA